jgi:ATP-binding cassette, subfamily B, multidrug efflux pump
MSTRALVSDGVQARSLAGNLVSLLRPWRARVAVVVLCVLAAGTFELAPPFVVRTIVDEHLVVGRSSGLLLLAALYLAASTAVQAMTFVYGYLAATVA